MSRPKPIRMTMDDSETWMFSNGHKVLFLIIDEAGSHGYVIDTQARPWARHATKEDMITNQYTSAQRVKASGGATPEETTTP